MTARPRSLLLVAASALALTAPPATSAPRADALPYLLDVATLLDLVRERSPMSRALRADGEVAAADLIGADRYPNPGVDYAANVFLGGVRPDSAALHQVMVTQPLLIGGQRGARRDTARRALEAARAGVDVALADLARDARLAFAELQAAMAREEAIDAVITGVERLSRVVAERHKSGHASRYDIARMALELERRRVAREGHEAETDRAARALGVLLGLPGWAPRASTPLAPLGVTPPPGDGAADDPGAGPRPPAVVAAEREIDAARSVVEVARSERWPDLHVAVGTSLGHSAFAGELLVGAGVEIPLFDFGEGEVARARAEVIAAQARLEATEAAASAAAASAANELAKRRAALARFEASVPGQLAEIAAMAEVAYRGGQASLLDLLDVLEQEHEVRVERIDLTAAVVDAEVTWLHATGRVATIE